MTGIEDFSGFEVIRAAMEVEKNGHRFYSSMVERAHSELVRELFTWLAQDEVQHLRTLEGLVPLYQEGAFWEEEDQFLPYLRRFTETDIFPSAERLQTAFGQDHSDVAVLDLAIEAEEKFSEFFKAAAGHARSPDGKQAFSWLAGEEERHARLLKERKAKVLDRSDS